MSDALHSTRFLSKICEYDAAEAEIVEPVHFPIILICANSMHEREKIAKQYPYMLDAENGMASELLDRFYGYRASSNFEYSSAPWRVRYS